MSLKQKLFSNMFLRNMLASFGERSAYSEKRGQFTAYFLYKIGNYESDYYLYFPAEPFPLRYKNEIFNKLHEYTADLTEPVTWTSIMQLILTRQDF